MRGTAILGWIFTVGALFAMVTGHFGAHGLSWQAQQISTYAATAPFDAFVTASMLLSAAAILVVGVLITKYGLFGHAIWVHLVPPMAGAAAAGLVMVASYEETAPSLTLLKQASFLAIRLQSFHDAGLQVFFYSSVLLITTLGALAILSGATLVERLIGVLILSLGPGSFLLMRASWTQAIGMAGASIGLQQRAALLCLWLAVVCVLVIASGKQPKRTIVDGS